MACLLDTNIAIRLRDCDPDITAGIAALDDAVIMSIVTRVELEGGVYRHPARLVTMHASDFAGIVGLEVESW